MIAVQTAHQFYCTPGLVASLAALLRKSVTRGHAPCLIPEARADARDKRNAGNKGGHDHGWADLNNERLALALEAARLDLWENDLITGNVTRKATKMFEELGFTEDEIVSGVQDIFDLVPTTSTPCAGLWPTT